MTDLTVWPGMNHLTIVTTSWNKCHESRQKLTSLRLAGGDRWGDVCECGTDAQILNLQVTSDSGQLLPPSQESWPLISPSSPAVSGSLEHFLPLPLVLRIPAMSLSSTPWTPQDSTVRLTQRQGCKPQFTASCQSETSPEQKQQTPSFRASLPTSPFMEDIINWSWSAKDNLRVLLQTVLTALCSS